MLLLQSETHPESGTTSYTYSQGRLATKTDAKGQVFGYTYDTLGRLTTVKRFASVNNDLQLAEYRAYQRVTHMRVMDILAGNRNVTAWTPLMGGTIYVNPGRVNVLNRARKLGP